MEIFARGKFSRVRFSKEEADWELQSALSGEYGARERDERRTEGRRGPRRTAGWNERRKTANSNSSFERPTAGASLEETE